MLNRRILRVKAMQTLFAYQQCREANYHIGKQEIHETFLPDLNSMEVQNKELLAAQGAEAVNLYKQNYADTSYVCSEGSDEKINEEVTGAVATYHSRVRKDFEYLRKQMIVEAEKIADRYIWMLLLPVELAKLAAKSPKKKHENLANNKAIQLLAGHEQIQSTAIRRSIHWTANQEEVKQWYVEVLKKDTEYAVYQKLKNPDWTADFDFLKYMVKTLLFGNELFNSFMSEQTPYWSEDKPIIKSLVTKTLKNLDPESPQFELEEFSYNWEDDKEFFKTLFENTVRVEAEYHALIAAKARNWEMDRIAKTDKILLEMAIGEMINFPGIPVKVTINEYIEISKNYSTPKSKVFINGILDVIAAELTEKGVIRKSGRGLIDNK
jgi:transcription antitermination protein NusB